MIYKELFTTDSVTLEEKKRKVIAHKNDDDNKVELLSEHGEKTEYIFDYLLKEEEVIDNLLDSLYKEYSFNSTKRDLRKLFSSMAKHHDIGKVNPVFQRDVIENPSFADLKMPNQVDIQAHHSEMGGMLFSLHVAEHYDVKQQPLHLLTAHIIYGHHTRTRNLFEHDLGIVRLGKENTTGVGYVFEEVLPDSSSKLWSKVQDLMNIYGNDSFHDRIKNDVSVLSFLYNYLYSTLVRADSIANEYAFSNLKTLENKIDAYSRRVDKNLLSRMKAGVQKKQKEYSKKVYENRLNKYKNQMFNESNQNLDNGLNEGKRLFYLQMPTGGGKTDTGLALSLKILEQTEADRIVYALPYLSLLEQNYDVFVDRTGLSEDELRPLHSLSSMPETDENSEEVVVWDEFFEYPVICTTTVSLFNKIIKSGRRSKLGFGALANSVIVLDEIQTLPVEYWAEFTYLLQELCDKLNCYVIIMSATVPNLDDLKFARFEDENQGLIDDYHHLIDNPEQYFKEFKRNEIVGENIETVDVGNGGISSCVEYVFEKMKREFDSGEEKGLAVVNTVELSRKLYEKMKKEVRESEMDVEVLLLNSTVYPPQKENIKNKINSDRSSKKLMLISTQSVEAGLDVSFDFVIRDLAPLESIEQVRGRCKRYEERPVGNVYLADLVDEDKSKASYIYADWRLEVTEELLEKNNLSYEFDDMREYFERVIQHINDEIGEDIGIGPEENIMCWNEMKYEKSDSPKNKNKLLFHVDVIERNRKSFDFFICTDIGSKHFDDKELDYLENELLLDYDELISGKKVLERYRQKQAKTDDDYKTTKVLEKKFSSILSKYTTSAVLNVNEIELESQFEKFGPFYIIEEPLVGDKDHHIFSEKKGLNKKYFDEKADKNNII